MQKFEDADKRRQQVTTKKFKSLEELELKKKRKANENKPGHEKNLEKQWIKD